jgi:hypothetical protein
VTHSTDTGLRLSTSGRLHRTGGASQAINQHAGDAARAPRARAALPALAARASDLLFASTAPEKDVTAALVELSAARAATNSIIAVCCPRFGISDRLE